MSKPPQQDDPVWSILPSYEMYQQFLYDPIESPPQYGDTHSTHSSAQISTLPSSNSSTLATSLNASASASLPSQLQSVSSENRSLIVADTSSNSWRETILDNIHRLRNISSSDNPYTTEVEVNVHFTQEVGRMGEDPVHIDPSKFEYKQGDFINGYVLMKNNGPKPLPFDVFYVLFEGNYTFLNTRSNETTTKKFLEMYDFAASWNEAAVNRLLSDPDRQYPGATMVDCRDNAQTCMRDRVLKPGVLYKRFFTFKIPEKLLDSECSDHNLPSHSGLPPTMGLSESEKKQWDQTKTPISDFPFVNTATSYGVLARFIGKASTFKLEDDRALKTKLIDGSGDEFIIFRETESFIRVVQENNLFSEAEALVNKKASALLYDHIRSRIEDHLKKGLKQIEASKSVRPQEEPEVQDLSISDNSPSQKIAQLYTSLNERSKNPLPKAKPVNYTIAIPVEKKSLLNSNKVLGMLHISTPKTEYVLNYMSPRRFQSSGSVNPDLWKIEIPISVQFQPSNLFKGQKVPEITSIVPELVVFTMMSKDDRFPVEFTHDMLFRNHSNKIVDYSTDTFEENVQNPLKSSMQKLKNVITTLGVDRVPIERSLWRDARTLVNANVKRNNLSFIGAKVEDSKNRIHTLEDLALPLEENNGEYSAAMTVKLDATKAFKKGTDKKLGPDYSSIDDFCLVPSFQTCHLVRMYYIRMFITFSTKDMIELKVPVNIAKFSQN